MTGPAEKMDAICAAIDPWSRRFKLKARDRRLLVEAYRRYHRFHRLGDGQTICKAWLGLGKPSTYGKSPYFRPHGGTATPRVANWWLLTEAGIDALVDLVASLPWDKDYGDILFTY